MEMLSDRRRSDAGRCPAVVTEQRTVMATRSEVSRRHTLPLIGSPMPHGRLRAVALGCRARVALEVDAELVLQGADQCSAWLIE